MEDDGKKKFTAKIVCNRRETQHRFITSISADSSNSKCINTLNMVLYAYLPNDIEYLNMMLKLSIIAYVLCLIWDHAIFPLIIRLCIGIFTNIYILQPTPSFISS